MTEDLDDLTLVYMYGAKNGRDSMKAEIERLEARLAQARAEIEELRLQNEILVQTTAELCDRCGWRMKFPGQPCRHCEAPALAALEGEKTDDAAT